MTDHAALAEQYFRSGCNCAQSVICAFADCTGLDFETSMKLGSSFGGGFGRMREVCGAFSGACLVAGLLWGYDDPAAKTEKAEHYALIQDMAARFREQNGSIICRELLEGVESSTDSEPSARTAEYYKKRPCAKISACAAAILDEIIAERGWNKE
ncbi:MAG: C_GCAxxG_C_C family protein [Clostridia bacterium]|nr:C_GCAxxG_C_C family protein [Clostridia bacterium]